MPKLLSRFWGCVILFGASALASDLAITSPATLPSAAVGAPYTFRFSATGGVPPYTWRLGLGETTYFSIDSTGLLSGTPRAQDQGQTLQIRIRVIDSVDNQVTQTFALPISGAAALSIVSAPPPPNGKVGDAYLAAFTATGGRPPYTWSTAGSLPPGTSMNPSTGTLAGTPTTAGTFPFRVIVTDAAGASATADFSVMISAGSSTQGAALAITTASPLPGATAGALYRQTLAASGGQPPYTWRFPLGEPIGFLSIDASTGVLSGTPPDSLIGQTLDIHVMVTDAAGQVATKTLRLLIVGNSSAPLRITTDSLPGAFVGLFYTAQITASGGTQPYRWSVVDDTALPAGMMIDLTSGMLYGVPPAEGTYRITVQVQGFGGGGDQRELQLIVTTSKNLIPAGPMPPVASPVAVFPDSAGGRVYFINRGMFDVYLAGGGAIPSNAVSVYDIAADKLTRAIFVGKAAAGDYQGAALDSARHLLWVPNADDNTVSMIDTVKGKVINVITVGGGPTAAAVDPATGSVYIANQQDHSIAILDAGGMASGSIALDGKPGAMVVDANTRRIYVAVAAQPWQIVAISGSAKLAPVVLGNARSLHGLAIDAGTRLYAADATGQVYMINLRGSQPALEGSFTAGRAPTGVAFDPVKRMVYVADFDSSTVGSFLADGTPGRSFDVTKGPVALAIDATGRKAYVADFLANGYSIIDLERQTVQASMPVGGIITGLAYDRARGRLYGSNLTANAVTVVDASARKPLAAWRTGNFPWSIAVDSQLGQIYTIDVNDNQLTVLSADDGTIRKRIRFTEPKTDAAVVAVHSQNGRVYATQGTGSQRSLTILDGGSNTPFRTVDVGDRPIGIAVDEDNNVLYVGCRNSGTVVALDAWSGDTLAQWSQSDAPYMLAVDPDYLQLYVTVPPNKPTDFAGLLVLNSMTGEVLSRIKLGSDPEAVVVDRPTGHVFVSDPTDGTVSVIDGASLTLTKVLPVGNFAFAMTVDPDHRMVYLANGTDGTISAIQDSADFDAAAPQSTGANPGRRAIKK